MKVVLAQTAPLWGDAKGSGQAVLQSLSQVPPSTRMVLLPELWSCSYDNPRMEHHAKESPGLLDALAAWARDRRSGVLAGSLPWPVDGGMVNRTWLLNDTGSPVGFYDKTHLFPLSFFYFVFDFPLRDRTQAQFLDRFKKISHRFLQRKRNLFERFYSQINAARFQFCDIRRIDPDKLPQSGLIDVAFRTSHPDAARDCLLDIHNRIRE